MQTHVISGEQSALSADISDEALMAAAVNGDSAASGALYRRYADELRRYFARLESREVGADDLVQETFVRVLRYAASFDDARQFRGWLFAIARNVGLAAAHARRDVVELSDVALESGDDAARSLHTRESLTILGAALQELPEADRTVLVLAKLEGRSYRDIAHMLAISEGVVKVRVFRALQRLRNHLRAQGNPGGWLDEY